MHQKSSLTDPVASDQARIIEGLDQIVDLPGDFHRFSAISIRGVFLCRQRRRLGGSVPSRRNDNVITMEIGIIIQGYHAAQQNCLISYVDESHVTIKVRRLSR